MGPEAAPVLVDHDRGRLRILAIYHSHPQHDAYFSAEDSKQATIWDEPSYPDAAQIVVSVFDGKVQGGEGVRLGRGAARLRRRSRWRSSREPFVSPREGGSHIHFTEHGDGSPTIVLTHGLAASGDTGARRWTASRPRYRTVTWDLRGHGASSSPDGPYVLADLADDLRNVLDASHVERAVVLGHSAGGVIAMQFALRYPERTAGLVLVGTASECNERAHQFYEDLAAIAEQRGMASVHKRLGLGADYEGPAANPTAFAKVARCMGNLLNAPLTPRLGEIRCPTLIIVGEKDFLGAGGSVILSRRIAGSRCTSSRSAGTGSFSRIRRGSTPWSIGFCKLSRTQACCAHGRFGRPVASVTIPRASSRPTADRPRTAARRSRTPPVRRRAPSARP